MSKRDQDKSKTKMHENISRQNLISVQLNLFRMPKDWNFEENYICNIIYEAN